jgi:hypothetical protein
MVTSEHAMQGCASAVGKTESEAIKAIRQAPHRTQMREMDGGKIRCCRVMAAPILSFHGCHLASPAPTSDILQTVLFH